MHYSDNSHRWIAPPHIDQVAWNAGLRAHLALHLETMGGAIEADALRANGPARSARSQPAPAGVLAG